jgi:hypothetical protein
MIRKRAPGDNAVGADDHREARPRMRSSGGSHLARGDLNETCRARLHAGPFWSRMKRKSRVEFCVRDFSCA